MARKTSTFTVESNNRDSGKHFTLTEMAATKAEDWAIRVILALGNANVDIPEGALQLGMSALAEIGLKKLFAIGAADMKPLLTELMECVQFVPNPQKPQVTVSYPMFESQIEEVETLLVLKWQVLKLHMDFFQVADPYESIGNVLASAKRKSSTQTSQK